MKKMLRKVVSILLVLAVAAGLTAGWPLAAYAEEPPMEEIPAMEAEAPEDVAEAGAQAEATPTDVEEAVVTFDAEAAVAQEEQNSLDSALEALYKSPDAEEQAAREAVSPYGDRFTFTNSEFLVGGNFARGSEIFSDSYRLSGHAAEGEADLHYRNGQSGRLRHEGDGLHDAYIRDGDYTSATEGDFGGTGRKNGVAVLVYRKADPTGIIPQHQFEIYEWDAVSQLQNSSDVVGRMVAKFAAPTSYSGPLLDDIEGQGELHIAAGDVDGDGRDEIVALVPNYTGDGESARLLVYRVTSEQETAEYGTLRSWTQVYDQLLCVGFGRDMEMKENAEHTIREHKFTQRSHSLTVGDLNRDGVDDIVAVGSAFTFHSTENSNDLNMIPDAYELLDNRVVHEMQIVYGAERDVEGSPASGPFVPLEEKTYGHDSAGENSYENALFGNVAEGALLDTFDINVVGMHQYKWLSPAGWNRRGSVGLEFTDEQLNNREVELYPTQLGVSLVDVDGGAGAELLLGYATVLKYISKFEFGVNKLKKIEYASLGYRVHTLTESAAADGLSEVKENLVECLYFRENQVAENDTAKGYLLALENFSQSERNSPLCTVGRGTTYAAYNKLALRLTAARMGGPEDVPAIIVGGFNQHRYDPGRESSRGYRYSLYFGEESHTDCLYMLNQWNREVDVKVYSVRPGMVSSIQNGVKTLNYGFAAHYEYWSNYSQVENGTEQNIQKDSHGYTLAEFVSGNNVIQAGLQRKPDYPGVTTLARSKGPRGTYANTTTASNASSFFFCMPDTDHDSIRLDLVGYSLVHTDPVILAALAAAPYYADAVALGDDVGETSFGQSVGTGREETTSKSTSLGGYVATDVKVGVDAFKGVFETEINAGTNVTKESSFSESQSFEVTFSASSEDCVALASWPMDVFEYEMTYPTNEAGTEFKSEPFLVNVPYGPSQSIISLEKYNELYQRYPDVLPDLDKDVFTHTTGYPASYPRASYGYADAVLSKPAATINPGSTGTIEGAISMTEDKSEGTTNATFVDFKVGVGIEYELGTAVKVGGAVTAGFTLNHESARGVVVSNSHGKRYSGTVPNPARQNFNAFNWQLMQYNYRGKQEFPVITYVVSPGSNYYPRLPEDYGIDNDQTTDDTVAVRWTPSPDDLSPGDWSSMEYLVLNADLAIPVPLEGGYTYDHATGSYTFLHKNREPGTKYTYAISCRTRGEQNQSVATPVFTGTTNPDTGVYAFSLQPQDRTIRAGEVGAELTAGFSAGSFTDTPGYNWQRWYAGEWQSITDDRTYFDGASTSQLKFLRPAAGLAGRYRAIVTLALAGNKSKQFVSDTAEVSYSKHASAVDLTLPGTNFTDEEVTVSAFARPGSGAFGQPAGGSVMFTLTAPTGTAYYAFSEIKAGAASGAAPATDAATATATLALPYDGSYTLEATYLGDSNFNMSHSAKYSFTKNGNASTLSVSTSFSGGDFAYGDSQHVRVTQTLGGSASYTGSANVSLLRYTSGKWEVADTSGWVTYTAIGGSSGTGFDITFADVGRYRLAVSLVGASNTAYHDFTVTPRPVTYRIQDVLRYIPQSTPAKSDLTLAVSSGSILPRDEAALRAAGYRSNGTGGYESNLAVYQSATSPTVVPLGGGTPAGTYAIRLIKEPEGDVLRRYNITVVDGAYRVVEGGEASSHVSVEFYVPEWQVEQGSVRAVTPPGLLSGGTVPVGTRVVLEAVPSAGYAFDKWVYYQAEGPGDATEYESSESAFLTIPAMNYNFTAIPSFLSAADIVSSISVTPAGARVSPGGSLQFSAQVTGGRDQSVVWSIEGAAALATTIGRSTGLLSVAKSETASTLTVRATSVEKPEVTGEVSVTLSASGVKSITLTRVDASVPRGATRQFIAAVVVDEGIGANVQWSVSGGTAPGTTIQDGLLSVAVDEAVGAVLTVRAAALADSAVYDEQKLVVTDGFVESDFALSASHITFTSTGAAYHVVDVLSTRYRAGGVEVFLPGSDRTEPVDETDSGIRVQINASALNVTKINNNGMGRSFVMRVTADGNSDVWAECRVDIAESVLGADPADLELRATAKTVQANAYSTAPILIPVYRTVDANRLSWALDSDEVTVRLDANNNDQALLDAFEPVLPAVDGGHLQLMPVSDTAMEGLKSTYRNVKLTLSCGENSDGAEITDATAALASDFTLSISKKLPTVKAKQVVLDTWADDSDATAIFTGATVQSLVPAKPLSGSVKKWLHVSDDGLHYSAIRGAKGGTTLKMKATLEGWTKTVNVSIPVKATSAKPGLKLKSATAKLYETAEFSLGAAMRLLPKTKSATLKGLMVDHVEVAPPADADYTVSGWNADTGAFTLSARGDPTNDSIKLRVYFSGARASQTMDLPVRVSVVKSSPRLKAAGSKITLNTTLGDSAGLTLSSNIADLDLSRFYVDAVLDGDNNAKLAPPVVSAGNGAVRFAVTEDSAAKMTNKYTLRLWAQSPAGDTGAKPLHKLTVRVSTTDAAASVSLLAKGKLDISRQSPAPVTLTAKLKNYQGAYSSGAGSVKFATYYKNGKTWEPVYDEETDTGERLFNITRTSSAAMTWQITPTAGANICPGSYRVAIVRGPIPTSSEEICRSASSTDNSYATFTVKASRPKAAVSSGVTLYRGDAASEQVVRVKLPAGWQDIGAIELNGQDGDKMYFAAENLGGGYVAIHFREKFKNKRDVEVDPVAAAKSTTLTLNIRLKGNAATAKLTTAKVKVTVL